MSFLDALFGAAQKLIGVAAPVAQEEQKLPGLKNAVALKQVVSGLQAANGLNWTDVEKTVGERFANVQDDLVLVEDIAQAVAMFFPPAIYAEDIAAVLLILVKLGGALPSGTQGDTSHPVFI